MATLRQNIKNLPNLPPEIRLPVQEQDHEQHHQKQQQQSTATTTTTGCECPACDESCSNPTSEEKMSIKFMVKETTMQFRLKSRLNFLVLLKPLIVITFGTTNGDNINRMIPITGDFLFSNPL